MAKKYNLKVSNLSCENLLAVDGGGFGSSPTSSDPYLSIKCGEEIYKTDSQKKNLNPVFEDVEFTFGKDWEINVEEEKVVFRVYDYNSVLKDESLGIVSLDLKELLPANQATKQSFLLEKTKSMSKVSGSVTATLELIEVSQEEKNTVVEQEQEQKNDIEEPTRGGESKEVPKTAPAELKKMKKLPTFLLLTVIEGKGLLACDGLKGSSNRSSDPFVKIKCGEKQFQKTKVISKTLNPKWKQQFYFSLSDFKPNFFLELIVEDEDTFSNDFMGELTIDLHKWAQNYADEQDNAKLIWLPLLGKNLSKKQPKMTISPGDALPFGKIKLKLQICFENELQQFHQGQRDDVETGEVINQIDGDEGDEDCDDSDEEEEESLEKEEELSEEEKKKKKEQEEQLLAELEAVEFKSGDYQIQVHIHEVRDLKAMDLNGSCDPVVFVEALDLKKSTVVKQNCSSCVYDEILFFNLSNIDKKQVESAVLNIKVMDADAPNPFLSHVPGLRNELIGSFQIDLPYIYYKQDHELYQTWVGLSNENDAQDNSVQGYLKFSVVVLGPGDKRKRHKPKIETEEFDSTKVLMPPRIEKKTQLLKIRLHEAQDLPNMDESILKKGGIDAYIKVKYGGQDFQTKHRTMKGEHFLNVQLNQQILIPVTVPTMQDKIQISVWDWDLTCDELVASLKPFSYKRLLKYPLLYSEPFWANLYGAPLEDSNSILKKDLIKLMNEQSEYGTAYRGKLLLSLSIEEETELSKSMIKKCRKIKEKAPSLNEYNLEGFVISGSEIPQFRSKTNWGNNSRMSVRFCLGKYETQTKRVQNIRGICRWSEFLQLENILLTEELPDLFVYLVRGNKEKKGNICYARFPPEQYLNMENIGEEDIRVSPQWVCLKEEKVLDELTDGEFPGSLLIQFRLTPSKIKSSVMKDQWQQLKNKSLRIMPHVLHVHAYQGRGLPAADSNGLLDPFLKVLCNGTSVKTKHLTNTRDPCFYQTIALDVELPTLPTLMPNVVVQVWDWDQWDSDDYAGSIRAPLDTLPLSNINDPLPSMPQWYPLFFETPGDSEGELLLSFQLFRKSAPDQIISIPKSIKPAMEKKKLEILCLGCRNLKPNGFLPIHLPFLKFDTGESEGSNSVQTTKTSAKPSPFNPNYLERIVLTIDLPKDAMFAPRLNISLYDTLLGGFHKPLLGTCAVSLEEKMPFSNGLPNPSYKRPNPISKVANPYLEQEVDVSCFPGVKSLLQEDFQKQGVVVKNMPTNVATRESIENEKPVEKQLGKKKMAEKAAIQQKEAGVFTSEILAKYGDPSSSIDEGDDDQPLYLKNRKELEGSLEELAEEDNVSPFETYSFFRGAKLGRSKLSSKKSDYRMVGKMKGILRILSCDSHSEDNSSIDLQGFLTAQPYLIRLYVLNGINLQPHDANGKSDPYLVVKLGENTVANERKNFVKETLNPKFHKCFELATTLPGASTLATEVYDHDYFIGDDYIGGTTIDLEDRWFNTYWQNLGLADGTDSLAPIKPIECRSLYSPISTISQGSLRMWMEILSPHEATKYIASDVSLPPVEEFELRVVIYKTRDVIAGDEMTGLSDLYVKCWLEQTEMEEKQETDVHWRCTDGKGSFNFRMKFPFSLPLEDPENKPLHFHVQLWDKDVLYDDLLGEHLISLNSFLQTAYKTKQPVQIYNHKGDTTKSKRKTSKNKIQTVVTIKEEGEEDDDGNSNNEQQSLLTTTKTKKPKAVKKNEKEGVQEMLKSIKTRLGMGEDPPDSKWITCTARNMEGGQEKTGEVLLSLEVLPKAIATSQKPAGLGRSEPNNFPFLPEPTGRLNLSAMWNPLYVFEALVGPKIYHTCASLACCALIVAVLIFAGPLVNIILQLVQMLPSPYGWVALGVMLFLSFLICFICLLRCKRAIQ